MSNPLMTSVIRLLREVCLPRPILIERSILKRVIGHLEGRRQTWAARGLKEEYRIGDYFEFGCYNGDSLLDFFHALRIMYGRSLPPYWRMFGFDSFEGLPPTEKKEDLHPIAGKGSYSSAGTQFVENRLRRAGCPPERVRLIKGFYEDALTDELRNQFLKDDVKPSFVNIDCDYYSSTMTVLEWIEPLLMDGTIVYFDDIYFYNCDPMKGELKAIRDFNASRTESGLGLAPWFDSGARCYMYWRRDEVEPHEFKFEKFVTG